MDTPLIEFKQVTKRFGRQTVLERIDLTIFSGQVTTIIGKSGVGKSVLLKHIIGLYEPDEGHILLRGEPLNRMSPTDRAAALGRISYMFQNNALFDALTVYDNVALPLRRTAKLKREELDRRVQERLRQTELAEVAAQYPSQLSGGMQKRAALARALVTDPQIVLFDEPTTGQDPIRRNAILSMIADYQHRLGFTAVLISHDLPDVLFISNRVIALYDGAVIFQGSPEAFDELEHPFRDEFVHSLEALQQELSGLYSRRYFKVRYHNELQRPGHAPTYALVSFNLSNTKGLQRQLGYTATQEIIHTLGLYINKHFNKVGGASTRVGWSRFNTLLPNSDIAEAKALVADFAADFRQSGVLQLQKTAVAAEAGKRVVAVILRAGIAMGEPHLPMDIIQQTAADNRVKILEFKAVSRGRSL